MRRYVGGRGMGMNNVIIRSIIIRYCICTVLCCTMFCVLLHCEKRVVLARTCAKFPNQRRHQKGVPPKVLPPCLRHSTHRCHIINHSTSELHLSDTCFPYYDRSRISSPSIIQSHPLQSKTCHPGFGWRSAYFVGSVHPPLHLL